MKRRWPVYRLLLLIALVLAVGGIVLQIVTFSLEQRMVGVATIALHALIGAAAAAVLFGLWSFALRMRNALRSLLAGEFENDIETRTVGELAELTELTSRAMAQLKEYDKLRALRTGYASRAMYLLLGRLTTPAIIFDLPRGTGRANPACQRAFDLTRATISMEFLRRQDTNEEFTHTFNESFEHVKRERNIACMLRLSPGAQPREVDATFVPIKGEDDVVELGLILLTLRAQTSGAKKASQKA